MELILISEQDDIIRIPYIVSDLQILPDKPVEGHHHDMLVHRRRRSTNRQSYITERNSLQIAQYSFILPDRFMTGEQDLRACRLIAFADIQLQISPRAIPSNNPFDLPDRVVPFSTCVDSPPFYTVVTVVR